MNPPTHHPFPAGILLHIFVCCILIVPMLYICFIAVVCVPVCSLICAMPSALLVFYGVFAHIGSICLPVGRLRGVGYPRSVWCGPIFCAGYLPVYLAVGLCLCLLLAVWLLACFFFV